MKMVGGLCGPKERDGEPDQQPPCGTHAQKSGITAPNDQIYAQRSQHHSVGTDAVSSSALRHSQNQGGCAESHLGAPRGLDESFRRTCRVFGSRCELPSPNTTSQIRSCYFSIVFLRDSKLNNDLSLASPIELYFTRLSTFPAFNLGSYCDHRPCA